MTTSCNRKVDMEDILSVQQDGPSSETVRLDLERDDNKRTTANNSHFSGKRKRVESDKESRASEGPSQQRKKYRHVDTGINNRSTVSETEESSYGKWLKDLLRAVSKQASSKGKGGSGHSNGRRGDSREAQLDRIAVMFVEVIEKIVKETEFNFDFTIPPNIATMDNVTEALTEHKEEVDQYFQQSFKDVGERLEGVIGRSKIVFDGLITDIYARIAKKEGRFHELSSSLESDHPPDVATSTAVPSPYTEDVSPVHTVGAQQKSISEDDIRRIARQEVLSILSNLTRKDQRTPTNNSDAFFQVSKNEKEGGLGSSIFHKQQRNQHQLKLSTDEVRAPENNEQQTINKTSEDVDTTNIFQSIILELEREENGQKIAKTKPSEDSVQEENKDIPQTTSNRSDSIQSSVGDQPSLRAWSSGSLRFEGVNRPVPPPQNQTGINHGVPKFPIVNLNGKPFFMNEPENIPVSNITDSPISEPESIGRSVRYGASDSVYSCPNTPQNIVAPIIPGLREHLDTIKLSMVSLSDMKVLEMAEGAHAKEYGFNNKRYTTGESMSSKDMVVLYLILHHGVWMDSTSTKIQFSQHNIKQTSSEKLGSTITNYLASMANSGIISKAMTSRGRRGGTVLYFKKFF